MSDEVKIVGEPRTKLGTAECRRLRQQGLVPANIYGHGQDPVAITMQASTVASIILSGTQVVDVEIGEKVDKAIIRDVQWDVFGQELQHIDLVRVDPNERVVVEVAIDLRGTSPGVTAGGVLDLQIHALTIDCPAIEIPDKIQVRINKLEIGDSILVQDLQLSPSFVVQNPADAVVVQVNQAVDVEATEESDLGPAEPELVGRREDGESEED